VVDNQSEYRPTAASTSLTLRLQQGDDKAKSNFVRRHGPFGRREKAKIWRTHAL
jgi:hypothetical protein